ncbi:MAG: inorganic diphosphatase [Christensenellales bacterium]
MNLWHDIKKDRIRPRDFLSVIEIPRGTKNKYELDKETGVLILDRVLYTSTHYPANYGFIPRTLAEDGDPLDVLVICSEAIASMSLVRCYPVGVIRMIDDSENDDKIIAIPKGDPTYNHIEDIVGLSPHLLSEFMHFFRVYKELENRDTADINVLGLEQALAIIEKSIDEYNRRFFR